MRENETDRQKVREKGMRKKMFFRQFAKFGWQCKQKAQERLRLSNKEQ